jgi:hypothetical protein
LSVTHAGRRTLSAESSGRCWVKTHYSRTGEVVVAICDEELVGRRLRLPSGCTVVVAESFYKGVLIDQTDVDGYIRNGSIINLLGERCIEAAVRSGLARKDSVQYVDGIPHIQLYL